MKNAMRTVLALAVLLISPLATSYPISTAFSSFEVLSESEFFSRYATPEMVTSLYDKGDNAKPNSWVVRGYWGGGAFWEDVSFGFERGLDGPYPILRTGGSAITVQPTLAISSPDTLLNAVALAVYTDQGFFGIVPEGPDDKFYPLYPGPDRTSVTTIFSINTVTPIPEPSDIPEPGVLLLVLAGLWGLLTSTGHLSHGKRFAERGWFG